MQKQLLVVLGMGRSGTSAISRGLQVLGASTGDAIMPAGPNNPKGFWEDLEILRINESILTEYKSTWDHVGLLDLDVRSPDLAVLKKDAQSMLAQKLSKIDCFAIKDPRLPRFLPFWQPIFVAENLSVAYVIALRDPLSVADSLARCNFDRVKSVLLWQEHLLAAVYHTKGQRRVIVDYDRLLDDPNATLQRIATQLGIGPIHPESLREYQANFLDIGLRHTRYTRKDVQDASDLPAGTSTLYSLLADCAEDKRSIDDPALALLVAEQREALRSIGPVLNLLDRLDAMQQSNQTRAGELTAALQAAEEQNQRLATELEAMHQSSEVRTGELTAALQAAEEQNQRLATELEATLRSHSWKLTKPLRITAGTLRTSIRTSRLLLTPGKQGYAHRYAFARTLYRRMPISGRVKQALRNPLKRVFTGQIRRDYETWIRQYDTLTDGGRAAIRAHITSFVNPPTFSVVMPTYNPPEKFLRKAIESVRAQIYPHWELCIADDASPLPHVRRVLEEYARKDPRIKVVFREQNGHISAASNSALEVATGDYIALLDHDDVLAEHALYWIAAEIMAHPEAELLYSDEDKISEKDRRCDPYFKPDWNPDLLLCQNYINHLGIYKKNIVEDIGGFRVGFEGSQDWDLALRFTKNLAPERIRHIPAVLYHWRMVTGSTAGNVDAKPYVVDAARKALVEYCGNNKKLVEFGAACNGVFHLPHFKPQNDPLVSIIIPTRNGFDDLKTCIESLDKTTYSNYEVIIIDNQSDEQRTLDYLHHLSQDSKFRILPYPHAFNYAAMHNWAVPQAKGEYICLLNNDTEIITPEWLEEMLGQAQRPSIGAVGAKLLYADNSLQHGGVITGIGGIAGHAHKHYPSSELGYLGRAALAQNYSAVTGACLLVSKAHWLQLCGMPLELPVAFNDVDFCLRLEEIGLRNVWLPQAVLYHHESKSRGSDVAPEKIKRFALEHAYMQWRWGQRITQDPAYNPNLTLEHENFELAWPPRLNKPWKPHPRSVPIPYGIASLPTQFINVTHHQPIEGSFLVPMGLDNVQLIGLTILIGTHSGPSDGVLIIQLNDNKGHIIKTRQSLIGAADNMPLAFHFEETTLSLASVKELNFQITLRENTRSVALWAYPLNDQWGHHIAGYEECALRIDLLITNE